MYSPRHSCRQPGVNRPSVEVKCLDPPCMAVPCARLPPGGQWKYIQGNETLFLLLEQHAADETWKDLFCCTSKTTSKTEEGKKQNKMWSNPKMNTTFSASLRLKICSKLEIISWEDVNDILSWCKTFSFTDAVIFRQFLHDILKAHVPPFLWTSTRAKPEQFQMFRKLISSQVDTSVNFLKTDIFFHCPFFPWNLVSQMFDEMISWVKIFQFPCARCLLVPSCARSSDVVLCLLLPLALLQLMQGLMNIVEIWHEMSSNKTGHNSFDMLRHKLDVWPQTTNT